MLGQTLIIAAFAGLAAATNGYYNATTSSYQPHSTGQLPPPPGTGSYPAPSNTTTYLPPYPTGPGKPGQNVTTTYPSQNTSTIYFPVPPQTTTKVYTTYTTLTTCPVTSGTQTKLTTSTMTVTSCVNCGAQTSVPAQPTGGSAPTYVTGTPQQPAPTGPAPSNPNGQETGTCAPGSVSTVYLSAGEPVPQSTVYVSAGSPIYQQTVTLTKTETFVYQPTGVVPIPTGSALPPTISAPSSGYPPAYSPVKTWYGASQPPYPSKA